HISSLPRSRVYARTLKTRVHFLEFSLLGRTCSQKLKIPPSKPGGVLSSGDVLLSHGLSPYYHRGCSVSLPCSEWERVEPLRYCHQSAEPHRHFAAIAVTQTRSRISGDGASDTDALQFDFSKNNQALAIH